MIKNPILIIDDDPQIAQVLKTAIEELNHSVEHISDGESGLQSVLANDYALVILDLSLPKMNGLEVCKQIRLKKQAQPLIMLTARTTELDQVLGLELGADDYICKPFSVPQLIARIKARLRIADNVVSINPNDILHPLNFGELVIDRDQRLVKLRGEIVTLTVKEYSLLLFLAENPGRPYSREQLMENVWNYTVSGYEGNVNTTVTRLRNKIEEQPDNPKYIKTVYGIGYRFARIEEL